MKILVVYDSVFGNTEKVAQAIGGAVESEHSVETVKAGEVSQQQMSGVNLLVVGSPTRAFTATKATKSFINGIPRQSLAGVKVAGFDTRLSTADVNSKVLNGLVKVFGYAAKPISDGLAKKGGNVIAEPEGFIVVDSEGPMKEGELERAAEWAKKLAL